MNSKTRSHRVLGISDLQGGGLLLTSLGDVWHVRSSTSSLQTILVMRMIQDQLTQHCEPLLSFPTLPSLRSRHPFSCRRERDAADNTGSLAPTPVSFGGADRKMEVRGEAFAKQ